MDVYAYRYLHMRHTPISTSLAECMRVADVKLSDTVAGAASHQLTNHWHHPDIHFHRVALLDTNLGLPVTH